MNKKYKRFYVEPLVHQKAKLLATKENLPMNDFITKLILTYRPKKSKA